MRTSLCQFEFAPARCPTDGTTSAPDAGEIDAGDTGVTRLIDTGTDAIGVASTPARELVAVDP